VPSRDRRYYVHWGSTANGILMVSFAREQMDEGKNARDAAIEAGFCAIRRAHDRSGDDSSAGAMAVGLGEGGEQMRRLAAL